MTTRSTSAVPQLPPPPNHDEDDEEEEFYETLDRVLSSPGGSSPSDDDPTPHRRRNSAYSLWMSEPSSVQERRDRLLHKLGLSQDREGFPETPTAADHGEIGDLGGGKEEAGKAEVPQTSFDFGRSPIVEEMMLRENGDAAGKDGGGGGRRRRRSEWMRKIKQMVWRKERERCSEEVGEGSERGGDEGRELQLCLGLERVKAKQCGGAWRELTALFVVQEVTAHAGAVWAARFSADGRHLASAGEDCVIHVWEAGEREWKGEGGEEGGGRLRRRRRKGSGSGSRWSSFSLEKVVVPEKVFGLSEKPVCSFHGHGKDVLDLSWSKSEFLLSSSMDKTVKMWSLVNSSCLRTFSHNDFVTCIQFNPSDENYFISGSLDAKVRIWSVGKREVVHWNDAHEMVTAVCYSPDGKGAFVGSNKGTCRLYNITDNKMQPNSEINLDVKKKKITGFQFAPGSKSELFVTSADSRIRVVDDLKVVHKFKGFRNKTSQISASLTGDCKHVICASEDSQVYVWRYDPPSEPSRTLGAVTAAQSYEHFPCKHVTVATAWPQRSTRTAIHPSNSCESRLDDMSRASNVSRSDSSRCTQVPSPTSSSGRPSERASATWPEEKLGFSMHKKSDQYLSEIPEQIQNRSAWGMVIVAAGRGGEIKVFQNFGYPARA